MFFLVKKNNYEFGKNFNIILRLSRFSLYKFVQFAK